MTELEAIDKLIEHYKNYKNEERPPSYGVVRERMCPLCVLYRKGINMAPNISECGACPWIIFEGDTCAHKAYLKNTAAQRVERLNRWKNILMGEKDVQQPAT